MDQTVFWELVERARSGSRDDRGFVERMAGVLARLGPEELVEYERQFARVHVQSYNWTLWGAAYLVMGGCFEDGFECFRAWLIAQGRQVFEKAVADPDSLADLDAPEPELGAFWRLAPQLYRAKVGRDMTLPSAALPNLGEQWDFDDPAQMERRYPRLFAKFGDALAAIRAPLPPCSAVEEEWVDAMSGCV